MYNELQLLILLSVCLRVSFQHFVRAPTLRFLQASSLRRVILDSSLSSNVTLWSFQYSCIIIIVASKLSGLAPRGDSGNQKWSWGILGGTIQKRCWEKLDRKGQYSCLLWDHCFPRSFIKVDETVVVFSSLLSTSFACCCCFFFTWVTTVQLRTAVRLSGQTEMISWGSGRAGNGALLPFKGWSLNQEALPPQQNNRWGIRFLCYVSLRKIAKKAALSAKKPFLTTNRGVSVKAWRKMFQLVWYRWCSAVFGIRWLSGSLVRIFPALKEKVILCDSYLRLR